MSVVILMKPYPAHLFKLFVLYLGLAELRGTRIIRRYEIHRFQTETHPSQLILTAEALWVWIDQTLLRPKPIPKSLVIAFEQYLNSKSTG